MPSNLLINHSLLFGIIFLPFAFLPTTLSSRFPTALPLVFGVLFIVVPLVPIYVGIWILIGKRFIFNKSPNTIIVEKPGLLLIRKKHMLSFADIECVDITYKKMFKKVQGRGPRQTTDGWKVSLIAGGEMTEVDHGTSEYKIHHLASEISKFTGTVLSDNSAIPWEEAWQ